MVLPNVPRGPNSGDPQVVSDTEGEEITPDNPEIVRNFPVDTTDPDAVKEVEGTVDAQEDTDKL